MNKAVVKICAQISLQFLISNYFGYIPKNGIAGYLIILFLILGGAIILSSIAAVLCILNPRVALASRILMYAWLIVRYNDWHV